MRWPERIDTERLVLRLPTRSDADAIFDGYARDPEVVRYLTWRPHGSIVETREFLDRLRRGWESATELTWG